jgi:hypothetical protein
MKYVQPISIVALQRLTWGEDGDQIADDVANGASSRSFSCRVDVSGRGSEHVFAALTKGQKCSFRVLDDERKDVTGFADVLYVPAEHHTGLAPEDVSVEIVTISARGYAMCPKESMNCLVVITLENSAWFSSKTFAVDVQVIEHS